MSTHVVTEFNAKPGRGDDVEKLLVEILGEVFYSPGVAASPVMTPDTEAKGNKS